MGAGLTTRLALTLVTGIGVLAGCAAPRHALVGQAAPPVEVVSSIYATISGIDIQSDGESLFISGVLRHRSSSTTRPHGHVDVSVVGADGTEIQKVGTQCKGARISRRKMGPCHFATRLSIPPSPGAKVTIEYHPDGGVPSEERL